MARERLAREIRAYLVLLAVTTAAGGGRAVAEVAAREDTLAACQDSADNDRDGRVDCWDEDCRALSVCSRGGSSYERSEDTLSACGDRVDNDGDGSIDCDDPDCRPWRICAGGAAPPPPPPAAPAREETLADCQDGRDNDGDGLADCRDQGCAVWPHCAAPPAPAPTTGRLRVACGAPGASVAVDGEARGPAPWEGELPPGEHRVRVEADGYLPEERTVTLSAGPGTTDVAIGLRPAPAEIPPQGPEPEPPAEREPIGWFALAVGIQVPFVMMGEAISYTTAGGSLVIRPTVAVLRRPIAFELGIQLAGGYVSDAAYPRIFRGGVEYQTSDAFAFYDAKFFQVGLYLGLTIPVWSTDRPIVALNLGITNGITAYPLQYHLDLALGVSWFATRLVELRLELIGVELRRVDAMMTRLGETDRDLRDVWVLHLAPAAVVNLRF